MAHFIARKRNEHLPPKYNPSNRGITCWLFVSLFLTCVGSLAGKSAGIRKMEDFKTGSDSNVDIGYLTCVFTSFRMNSPRMAI